MESLPGYDNWKLASPPEGPRRCTCGHDFDDHADPSDLGNGAGEYREPLLNLVVALEHMPDFYKRSPEVLCRYNDAVDALAVCQCKGCNCRKFETEA